MIGRLHGTLLAKEPPGLLVDVGGVGYELEAPMTTFYDLPAIGQSVTLHTHLMVREDAHLLFGFSRESQRQLFRELLKVNGVGPRVALAILSGLSDQEFVACVAQSNIARLTHIPGIGRKTAERLVVELRDKLPDMEALAAAAGGAQGVGVHAATGAPGAADPVSEAVSALIALGYKPQEASRAVRHIASKDASVEDIIRQALRSMAGA